MAADTDLIKLYSGSILALAADIPLLGRLESSDATVRRRSPVCGSMVTVDIVMSEGRVSDFRQDVKACALGQAAAAIVGEQILGRTPEELQTARDQLQAMLAGSDVFPEAPFDGFEVLQPARDFKNRHASIMLSIDAAAEASVAALEKDLASI